MKNIFLIFSLFLFSVIAVSQQITEKHYWATKLIDYSTQLTSKQHSAEQVLGKPNAMPQGGKSACAWSPKIKATGANSGMQGVAYAYNEYIEVGFEEAMKIKQIAVFENDNAGAITQVFLKNKNGKYERIYKEKKNIRTGDKGVFYIHLEEITDYEVYSVKIELNCQNVPNPQIDAIAISNGNTPIKAKINVIDAKLFESKPENLGKNINTAYADFSPVVSPDGNTLYFIRRDYPENIGGESDDIWYSKYDGNNWSVAKNMGSPLNNSSVNSPCSVLPDGNNMLLLYYKEDGSSEHGIHLSQKNKTGGWKQPEILKIDNFFNYNRHNEYYLANSGKTLLLTVERDFSLGGRDIYVCFKNKNGDWSEPQSLGREINTVADEASPFLAADDKTIYFSSGGYSGFGSNDIYMSKRLDDSWSKWTEPINLGSIINSEDWDAYYTFTASGEYAYFSSGVSGYGGSDVFRIKLPIQAKPEPVVLIKGKVINSKTKKAISTNIEYETLSNGKNIGIANSNPITGDYQIILPYGKRYGFLAKAKGYYAINQSINLEKIKEYKEIKRNIYLTPIEKGETIRLNNIFFDFNKSTLKPESFHELDRLVTILNENKKIKIEVRGHTDNKGEPSYNLKLSEERAKSVYDYLNSKKISLSRLSYKGYGETNPIAINTTDKGRYLNRRVEVYIIEK